MVRSRSRSGYGPPVRSETIDRVSATVYQLQRHGHFVMGRTKDGWHGTAYSIDDIVLGTCSFIGRQASCLLAPTLRRNFPTPPRHEEDETPLSAETFECKVVDA
jgi:hypothetical protein